MSLVPLSGSGGSPGTPGAGGTGHAGFGVNLLNYVPQGHQINISSTNINGQPGHG